MKQTRTIGIFSLACSAILLVMAAEQYTSDVKTATAVADAISQHIEGFEFESVTMATETIVCGLAGAVLFIAGLILLYNSMKRPTAGNELLLPPKS
ncbi:MAG: hypothetical protein ACI87E_003009 [Mariniblastus sp.]|jgi:hypothetical protein